MSILIKGMTMPTNCGECLLSALRMDCRLTGRDISRDWIKRKIPDFCPLVPVPPHGRLIDADAVQDTVLKLVEDGWNITRNDYKRLDDILYECPTVIEAEGEETNE